MTSLAYKPEEGWNRTAEEMMPHFAESLHFVHGLIRSLLLLEWHPTKPQSSNNCFASVGKLSASAVRIT